MTTLLKRFFFLVSSLLVSHLAFSQLYGNEWIKSGQDYYKILTYENGIYAISGEDLIKAGVPLSQWNASRVQLWHRGKQVPIQIKGGQDGRFDNIDSLIFYGKRNDGTLDSLLYNPINSQPHNYFNLHSDTCVFFLTYGAESGKRIQSISTASGSNVTNHYHKELLLLTEWYEEGDRYGDSHNSNFVEGEGWTSWPMGKNASDNPISRSFDIPLQNIYSTGDVTFETVLLGDNPNKHSVEIILGDPAAPIEVIQVENFEEFTSKKVTKIFSASKLTGSSLKVTVVLKGFPSFSDGICMSYFLLTYPQVLTFTDNIDRELNFTVSSDAKVFKAPGYTLAYDISDKNDIKQLSKKSNGDIIISGGVEKVLLTGSVPKRVHALAKANLKGYTIDDPHLLKATYLIVSHPKFMKASREYATYRNSTAGGKYDTLVANVKDLYDNFSYGEESPLAIKNFCRMFAEKGKPQYLLIVGRGVNVDYKHFFVGKYWRFNPEAYRSQVNTWNYVENFVPFAGIPTCDLLYVTGIGSAKADMPAFPVGRLNAKYESNVYDYLNKVKQHEALPMDELWRKNVLHLSGGKTENEIIDLKGKLQNLESLVTDTIFGGKVESVVKRIGYTVDDQLIETIAQKVNKGVSYITFLGHASPSVPDMDIGFASNPLYKYSNSGKYPMMILNGCNTFNGTVPVSLTEDWIITPEKGGIAVIGHSHYGYSTLLAAYTKMYYYYAFSSRETYNRGLSIGLIQKKVLENLANEGSFFINSMCQQMFLQGDPAIKMFSPSNSDFEITNSRILSLDGNPVSAVSDSFAIQIEVANYGLTSNDTLKIEVKRSVGTKVKEYYFSIYPAPMYKDTLVLTFKRDEDITFGQNTFTISVDPLNKIPETNKQNNSYILNQYFPLSIVKPLFPKEFSIVGKQPVNLVAQASQLLLSEREYYIELDTSAYFKSTFRKSTIIKSSPLVKWNNVSLLPDVPANDSTVYYWRVRFKEIGTGEDTIWGNSSFIYIKKSPDGWSQSTLSQLSKNETDKITIDDKNNKIVFNPTQATLSIGSPGLNYKVPDPNKSIEYYTQLAVNGEAIMFEGRGGCGRGLFALSFDKSSLVPYFPISGINKCGFDNASKRVNYFYNIASLDDFQGQAGLLRYIDEVKSGDYVMIMTAGDAQFSNWKPELKQKLKTALGARLIDSISNGMPYILIAKKDSLKPVAEITGQPADYIRFDNILRGKSNTGKIISPLIGPSSEWKTVVRDFKADKGDKYKVSLYGVSLAGITDTLIKELDTQQTDISFIDPDKYPYLQLEATIYDSTYLTPLKFEKWQVVFSEVPEGTLDPDYKKNSVQYKISKKMEGDSVKLTFAFTNISAETFKEKLKALLITKNITTGKIKTDTLTLIALKPDSTSEFAYNLSTTGWAGENKLQVNVNPGLQAEQYYTNNILELDFTVDQDKINPVLDVTFDGGHIMDGEIVSPDPYIVVSLKDENKVMFRTDTTGLDLYIKKPCSACQFEKIKFTSPEIVSWGQTIPGSNNFRIEYNPKKLPDGIYTLRVQGTDVAGNKSGSKPYEVSFQVVNESAVTNFYPYPNPFSTRTNFVFTITGNKIPQDLKIQIMTITGKVVKEISKAELGPIKIGNNKSEYAWDGKDNFGDQLANGVYLYRVLLKDQDDFKHRESAGDKAFKKNFGKIYLLR